MATAILFGCDLVPCCLPSEVKFMRLLRLSIVALIFVALISFVILGNRGMEGEIARLQGPAAETVEPTVDPNATPTPTDVPAQTPTPEPTGVDTTAPEILSLALQQSNIDTTAASQPLTVTAHIVDDLSGLGRAVLRFVPASGGTQFVEFEIVADNRVSGDRRDGSYVAIAWLPKYAAHGRWYLSQVTISDNANNSREGYLAGNGSPEPLRVAGMEPVYFVNGEDDGAPPIPTATPIFELPPPDSGAAADATPWANELLLPVVTN